MVSQVTCSGKTRARIGPVLISIAAVPASTQRSAAGWPCPTSLEYATKLGWGWRGLGRLLAAVQIAAGRSERPLVVRALVRDSTNAWPDH
jgi:hypothetical protein